MQNQNGKQRLRHTDNTRQGLRKREIVYGRQAQTAVKSAYQDDASHSAPHPSLAEQPQKSEPQKSAPDKPSEGAAQPAAPKPSPVAKRQPTASPVRANPVAASHNTSRLRSRQPKRMRIDMSLPGGASAADQRFRRVGRWWKTLRQVSARGGAAAVMLLVLTLGFLLGKGYWQLHHVFHGNQVSAASLKAHVDPDLLRGEGSGRINILLLGKGGPGHDGPDLTDTILVYSIDPVNHKAALLSVPRDLWVHSSFGNTKINAVYAKTMYRAQAGGASDAAANKAGVQAIEHKVSHLLDIPIHYYAMVDFTAFKQAINTVGGLTLNVPKQLYDPTMAWQNNGSPILAHKGRQHFNGYHALLYARSRETSSDFARTKRQRQVLTALEQKVFSLGTFTNPVKLTKLLDNFGNHAQTDLSIHDTLRLYDIVQQIPAGATKSLGLTDKGHDLMTTDYAGNQSVVRPKAGLFHYQPLQEFVRRALPDGYIVKEHAPITVLNGTDTPKAAHKVAKMLESYGYTVTHVGKAARHYQHTQVFDLAGSSKKYTAHYLRERFASKLKHQLPAGISQSNAKFVIIVGE